MKSNYIVSLDIGSSKICCIIGRTGINDELDVVGVGEVACRGLKGGVVVNIEETVNSITKAVEIAEAMAGDVVRSVYVNIKGGHVESFNRSGAISISRADKEILPEDVNLVMESAKAIQIAADREIIHTIPQVFIVDKQRGVPDPIGMEGSHLGVEVHIVTVSTASLNNIIKCINRAGFTIEGAVFGLVASSLLIVTQAEKELGVAFVDIGGQTVDLAIFLEGNIRFTKELLIGGDYIIRDIAYGLRTSLSEAKKLKEKYGVALSSLVDVDEEIEFLSIDGRMKRKISLLHLSEIIQPRVEEILIMVEEEIKNSGYNSLIPSGIIFTGGTAFLKGISQAAEQIFNMPTRIGIPQNVGGIVDIVSNPRYATGVGLLKYAQMKENRNFINPRFRKSFSFFNKVKNWMNEMF
ncbi:cell division protein FtsA [bacterium]|nr:cell division protein FtsA [bacterium]